MKVSGKGGSPTPHTDAAAIGRSGLEALTKADGADKADKLKDKAKNTAALSDSARVDVSKRAQQIKKAKELATPDMTSVNEEKVARLQKMIDEGKYNVSAESIADRLVDEHLNIPS
jgi:flagellar biosynthesis anti-sigma factor FlgM